MNLQQKIKTLAVSSLLLLGSTSWSQDSQFLAIYGKHNSSGNTVLATIDISKEAVAGRNQAPLSTVIPKLVANGVSSVVQGENKSLLYRRPGKLWRYSNGKYLQITQFDEEVNTDFAENLFELPTKETGSSGLLFFLRTPTARLPRSEDFSVGIFNYEGFYPSQEGVARELIGAISPTSFLVRTSRLDAIGRLTTRKLAIASVPSLKSAEDVKEEPVATIQDGQTEVTSAANGRIIATQLFDEKEQIFRIALIDSETKQLSWLPLPEKKEREDYYKKSFQTGRVRAFSWSPNQRYLAVNRFKYGTNVWDNLDKAWVMESDKLKIFSRDTSIPLLWLDNSHLVEVNQQLPDSASIQSQSVDKPDSRPEFLAEIKGISVLQLFNVNSEPQSNLTAN